MELFLQKDMVTEKKMTVDGVLVYVALRKIIDESAFLKTCEVATDYISINRLAFTLVGSKDKYEKAFTDSLKRGISELINLGLLVLVNDLSTKQSSEGIFDLSKLRFDVRSSQFIKLPYEDIQKILNLNEVMFKKISMVKYYIALIGCMDWSKTMNLLPDLPAMQGKICHMPQSYIGAQADISEKTCRRYNDVLVENKLIYIYKSNDKIKYDVGLKQINNCYSRYEDRKLCEMYGKYFENELRYSHRLCRTQKSKQQADENRRLAQIYNRICDGYSENYDEDTVRNVYEYVSNKNKQLEELIREKYSQDRLSDREEEYVENLRNKIRGLEVFDQFGFLVKEVS